MFSARVDGRLSAYADRLARNAAALGTTAARELNAAGSAIRKQTITAEAAQTGLTKRTIGKAQRATKATTGNLAFVIRAGGGNVRLKFFKARETKAGVTAAPHNRRELFAGSFIKGGRFPKRVTLNMKGQVFQRTGAGRLPIKAARSGVFISRELVTGETAAVFNRAAGTFIAGMAVRVAARVLP